MKPISFFSAPKLPNPKRVSYKELGANNLAVSDYFIQGNIPALL